MTEYSLRRRADGALSTSTTTDRAKAVEQAYLHQARGTDVALVRRTGPNGDWAEEALPPALVLAPTSRYLVRGRH